MSDTAAPPAIPPFSAIPTRGQQFETFTANANAFLAHIPTWSESVEELGSYVHQQAVQANNAVAAAQQARDEAQTASVEAKAVSGLANYMGVYDPAVGYQVGQSVKHGGEFWVADQTSTGATPTEGGGVWTKLPSVEIDDTATTVDRAWSANKISTELGNKADLTGADFTGGVGEGYNLVSSSAGTLTLDLSTGNNFKVVLSENTALVVTNAPAAGTAFGLRIKVVQDASGSGFTFTWPTGGSWPSATAPTLTADADAEDVFVLYTDNGFTTWDGHVAGQAMGVPA